MKPELKDQKTAEGLYKLKERLAHEYASTYPEYQYQAARSGYEAGFVSAQFKQITVSPELKIEGTAEHFKRLDDLTISFFPEIKHTGEKLTVAQAHMLAERFAWMEIERLKGTVSPESSKEQRFSLEDLKAAFEAGKSLVSAREFGEYAIEFDEWLKSRLPISS